MSDIKQYEPLWGAWQVDSLIGEGSFGKVYKVRREEFGKTYYSAVKMLSIPQSEADIRQIRGEGMDEASVRSYFHAFVADIIQEIDLMREFRGNSNIVSFEDHKVIEKPGEIGWDILIRMELLTSLSDYVMDKPLSQEEVVKLGIHICHALELCAVKKTIHRDVKPENIFVSQYGDYKLGDFGIARQIERTSSGLSKKGTYTYMAPEVFKGDEYGASVDMYSLGVVMYRFLNQNRTPFMPAFPTTIKPSDRDEALQRRMKGEPLPQIAGLNPSINAIIMKACAFDRKDRFTSPTQMREALEAVAGGGSYAPVDTPITTAGSHARTSSPQQTAGRDQTSGTAGVSGSVASKTAQPEDRTSATEGVYTSAPKAALHEAYREATERTEGVYETPPPRREEAARKSAPKKNWGAAIAGVAAVIIAALTLFISLNNNSNSNLNIKGGNNQQAGFDIANNRGSVSTSAPSTEPTDSGTTKPAAPYDSFSTTLRIATYSGEQTGQSQAIIKFAEDIKQLTDGRVDYEFYAGAMLLAADTMYDGVVEGIADIGYSNLAYTFGRFLQTEVLDLPLSFPNGWVANHVAADFYKEFKPAEFDDTHILALTTSNLNNIITIKTPIKMPDDVKGMQLRGTGYIGQLIDAFGGASRAVAMNDLYDLLYKSVIDGGVIPYETIEAFNYEEVTKNITEVYQVSCVNTFFIIMNKDTWNSFPPDIQEIITTYCEEHFIDDLADMWNNIGLRSKKYAIDHDFKIYVVPDADIPLWRKKADIVISIYRANMLSKGYTDAQMDTWFKFIKERTTYWLDQQIKLGIKSETGPAEAYMVW